MKLNPGNDEKVNSAYRLRRSVDANWMSTKELDEVISDSAQSELTVEEWYRRNFGKGFMSLTESTDEES